MHSFVVVVIVVVVVCRKLNPSKSVPLEADSVSQTKGMPLPAVPEPSRPAGFSSKQYQDQI